MLHYTTLISTMHTERKYDRSLKSPVWELPLFTVQSQNFWSTCCKASQLWKKVGLLSTRSTSLGKLVGSRDDPARTLAIPTVPRRFLQQSESLTSYRPHISWRSVDMIKPAYLNIYLSCSWNLISGTSKKMPKRYEKYLTTLINKTLLTVKNLIISLYYLYQHTLNEVVVIDIKDGSNLPIYLILTSLIISDQLHSLDVNQDQSVGDHNNNAWTLSQWNDQCHQISHKRLSILPGLLETLTIHFKSCLNNNLAFEPDERFWNALAQNTNIHWMNILRQEIGLPASQPG